jgi:hypothetical protein
LQIVALRALQFLALGLHKADVLLSLRALRTVDESLLLDLLEIVQSIDVVPAYISIDRRVLFSLEEIAYSQGHRPGTDCALLIIKPLGVSSIRRVTDY